MPENILVVEYEPRYTDRVKQALAGQPFQPQFAKDGDEALRFISAQEPRLIVLSSVVPKVSTSELIRAIRNRKVLAETPILLTVSGYNGKTPRQDAARLGASDILPKPYSESEFLGKVQQMLGGSGRQWSPELDSDFSPAAGASGASGFTSNEIFGELFEDDRAPSTGARKAMKPKDDLDKMLADTLAGVMPQRKKDPAAPAPTSTAAPTPTTPTPAPAAPKPVDARPKTQSGQKELDKLLNDTLSGIERQPGGVPRKTVAAVPTPPAPQPPPAAPPRPAPAPAPPSRPVSAPVMPTTAPKYTTEKLTALSQQQQQQADRVPVSQPVIASPPPAPVAAPAPAHEEEEPAEGTKFGQYVLTERIATGGMAEVWKASMRGVEGFRKTVAIKKILPHLSDNQDFIEMFIDEAKLAAQLNHNNIIHIYDLGKIQSSYYIAMEYIDGYDLKTILKKAQEKDQPLNVELALLIASKIAAALDYAHRKRDFDDRDLGLVHRDVSPQNVLISEDGDIKLCDFGIAKAASKASHTQAGALKGKLQYMSPEQAWGRNIDKRSDIFALATVLFELLAGRRLFTGDNELSILEQVREARVQPPSEFNEDVTPAIDAIVLKALQKDPANRYQTAGEMERDINQVLYTFKPTPTSADLAIFMHRLSTAETPVISHHAMEAHEPVEHDPKQLKPMTYAAPVAAAAAAAPVAMPQPAPAPALATPTFHDEPIVKKPPVALFAVAAVVLIGIIVGVVMMMKSKPSAAASTTTGKTAVTQSSAPAPIPGATSTVATSTTVASTTLPASTTLDPAKIDAEVQKRLAAEKAKLDQSKPTNPVPNVSPPLLAQNRPNQQPVAQQPAPQPVVAQPVPQPVAQQPAPQPVVPQPVPQPARTQPAEEPVARAHEGDDIPAGTEGLTPPRMTSQAEVTYPQMARMQRVQGVVILSVHVSETGRVLDVKVIRGDPRLNDAAVQSIRRSSFAPGTKDGVRVKSWVPVSVGFKL